MFRLFRIASHAPACEGTHSAPDANAAEPEQRNKPKNAANPPIPTHARAERAEQMRPTNPAPFLSRWQRVGVGDRGAGAGPGAGLIEGANGSGIKRETGRTAARCAAVRLR